MPGTARERMIRGFIYEIRRSPLICYLRLLVNASFIPSLQSGVDGGASNGR